MSPCGIECCRGALHMEGIYGVMFGGKQCGKVQVLRQGLYHRFICRCSLSGEVLCRLRVRCGEKEEELGLLVPSDGVFGLDRRIPAKRLGEGTPEFALYVRREAGDGRFVPIVPEEPFGYISRLKDAYLVRRNGQAGILI